MTPEHHKRGGAAVATLAQMETWEAQLVLNLRLWCEGPLGQSRARADYKRAIPETDAKREWQAFDCLVRKLIDTAHRPLVRHDVGCNCVGSDECVFLNLVRTASEGHLNDAALIATLLSGPAHAEQIAIFAGQVGDCLRRIHAGPREFSTKHARNVVRLH